MFLKICLSTALLLVAAIDDLRSKKIHNKLILILLPIAFIGSFLTSSLMAENEGISMALGLEGLKEGLISGLVALIIAVPLNRARFIGGGDLKLLAVFALTVDWIGFCYSFFYALPWAVLLGLFKIVLDKNLKHFVSNVFAIMSFKGSQIDFKQLHTIPFSLSFLFGWLSYVSLKIKWYNVF